MYDPLKAKAKVVLYSAVAFLFGIGIASGLGWTSTSHAMPSVSVAPQVSPDAVRPALDPIADPVGDARQHGPGLLHQEPPVPRRVRPGGESARHMQADVDFPRGRPRPARRRLFPEARSGLPRKLQAGAPLHARVHPGGVDRAAAEVEQGARGAGLDQAERRRGEGVEGGDQGRFFGARAGAEGRADYREALAQDAAEVDLGRAPRHQSDQHEAAARGERVEGAVEVLAADQVDREVGAVAVGGGADAGAQVRAEAGQDFAPYGRLFSQMNSSSDAD